MASLNREVQGVDTRFLKPTPTQGSVAAAQAVSSLGKAAVDVFKMAAREDFANKARDLEASYMEETKDFMTQEDLAQVDDFGKRLELLKKISLQKGKHTEYRIRAEALLKEKSAALPGLAGEFRQVAGAILGFDPTGVTTQARGNEIDAAAREAEATMARLDADAQSLGIGKPGDIFVDPGARNMYEAMAGIRERVSVQELMNRLNDATSGNKIDPKQIVNEWTKRAADLHVWNKSNASLALSNQVKEILAAKGITHEGEITWETLAQLTPQDKSALKSQLKSAKIMAEKDPMAYRAYFNEGEWKDFNNTAYGIYDELQVALDDEGAWKNFQSSEKLRRQLMYKDIYNSPSGQTMMALQDWGFNGDAIVQSQIGADVLDIMARRVQDMDDDSIPKKATGGDVDVVVKSMEPLISKWKESGELSPQLASTSKMMVDMLAEGDKYSADVYDRITSQMGEGDYSEALKQQLNANPALKAQTQYGVRTHTKRSLETVEAALQKGNKTDDGKTPYFLYMENGELRVGIDDKVKEQVIKDHARGNYAVVPDTIPARDPVRRRMEKELRKDSEVVQKYVNQFNRALSTSKKLFNEGTPEQYLEAASQALRARVRGLEPQSKATPSSPTGQAITPPDSASGVDSIKPSRADLISDLQALESGQMSRDEFTQKWDMKDNSDVLKLFGI